MGSLLPAPGSEAASPPQCPALSRLHKTSQIPPDFFFFFFSFSSSLSPFLRVFRFVSRYVSSLALLCTCRKAHWSEAVKLTGSLGSF